jgi:NADPH-dependent curcumin reductase CurA
MDPKNRQWILARRPRGTLLEDDFAYRETTIPEAALDEGQVLLQNLWLGFDATQREWLKDQEGYLPPVGVGEVVRASLCPKETGLVYIITTLTKDGKLNRIDINAVTGRPVEP